MREATIKEMSTLDPASPEFTAKKDLLLLLNKN
jgi:hypothetical protein